MSSDLVLRDVVDTLIQGRSGSVSMPASAGRVRGTCMGFTQGVLNFGQVVGPLLGVLAATLLRLPWAFTAISLLFGLAAAFGMRSAHTTRRGMSSASVTERADHDRPAAPPPPRSRWPSMHHPSHLAISPARPCTMVEMIGQRPAEFTGVVPRDR